MPSQGHSAKEFQKEKVNFLIPLFAECRISGHSAKTFKKNIESLPSAVSGALGKVFFKKNIFAECLTVGTRQRRTWPNTVTRASLCRVPRFYREPGTRQRSPLPSAILCRVRHSAKKVFAECPIFDTRQRSRFQ